MPLVQTAGRGRRGCNLASGRLYDGTAVHGPGSALGASPPQRVGAHGPSATSGVVAGARTVAEGPVPSVRLGDVVARRSRHGGPRLGTAAPDDRVDSRRTGARATEGSFDSAGRVLRSSAGECRHVVVYSMPCREWAATHSADGTRHGDGWSGPPGSPEHELASADAERFCAEPIQRRLSHRWGSHLPCGMTVGSVTVTRVASRAGLTAYQRLPPSATIAAAMTANPPT